MARVLAMACFLYFAATAGFAQSRLNGKWSTDRPANPQAATEAQRKQLVQLEVTIEGDRASGNLSFGGIGGRFYTFKDGKVSGNKVEFRTDPRTEITWTVEMVDDNTVVLYHGRVDVLIYNVAPTFPLQGTTVVRQIPSSATSPQQRPTPSIRGIVQDESKALIPGVTVTATNVDTGAKFTTATNESGAYGFSRLPSGKYAMTASVPGLRTATVSDLSVASTPLQQDFTLELPPFQASLDPSAPLCSGTGLVSCNVLHRAR